MKNLCSIILLISASVTYCSCTSESRKTDIDDTLTEIQEPVNSIYYWKTAFQLDSTDVNFMQKHDIEHIYLRMFDVVTNDNELITANKTIPAASVKFIKYWDYDPLDEIPNLKITPTVYITLDALKAEYGNEKGLAEKIVKRVSNMVSYNSISDCVTEFQLDCDWTESTRLSYFELCRHVKEKIEADSLNWRLSSTIRLHQLNQNAPPVDSGVLMLYNTGSIKNPDSHNSILDVADVKPYLKNLAGYPLHLDCAYPSYSWNLIFRNNKFIGIFRDDIKKIPGASLQRDSNKIRVSKDTILSGKLLQAGDIIRVESSPYNTISQVKKLVDNELKNSPHSNILYHFDSSNLSQYSDDEIKAIYN